MIEYYMCCVHMYLLYMLTYCVQLQYVICHFKCNNFNIIIFIINRKRLCHEEQDLALLVALLSSVPFLCVCVRLSVYAQHVLTVCACLILCTMWFQAFLVLCVLGRLLSTVLWQIAVQKGSAVFMSTNPPPNHVLSFWFALADCYQRWSDIRGR